jgi:hypothetical protein
MAVTQDGVAVEVEDMRGIRVDVDVAILIVFVESTIEKWYATMSVRKNW